MSTVRQESPPYETLQRELRSLSLYRLLEAALLALVFFGQWGVLFSSIRNPALGQAVAACYVPITVGLLLWAWRGRSLRWQVLVATCIDIVVVGLAIHAMPNAAPGIALMLLVNVGAAALLLPPRTGMAIAIAAAATLLGEFIWSSVMDGFDSGQLAERIMFAMSYMAFALITSLLGLRMRDSQALAHQRGADVADLAALNELIIRRMRTGVLLVDGNRRIRMINEAALALLGHAGAELAERDLAEVSPELDTSLLEWRRKPNHDDVPMTLGQEQTQVLPRFVQLMASSHSTLVFLDDASLVSRRAESMTLATLGRFSASLAHEIRNPLAAINYATQLLEESREIPHAERRLLQIIHQQCQRTNGIVESVLSVARRERASPEHVDLPAFVRRFVDDYQTMLPAQNGTLNEVSPKKSLTSMVDPRHLQQVLTALVANALAHGRMPGEAARVTVVVHAFEGRPAVDVIDRGPGIPPGALSQLFRPFFTTSSEGTGLGLYIARELCRANQATLDYIGMPAGGGCFRICLAAPDGLLPDISNHN